MFPDRPEVEAQRGRIGGLPEAVPFGRGGHGPGCDGAAQAQRRLQLAHLDDDRVIGGEPRGRLVEGSECGGGGVPIAGAVRRVEDVHPGRAEHLGTDAGPARGGAGVPGRLVIPPRPVGLAGQPEQVPRADGVQVVRRVGLRGRCAGL